MATTVGNVVFSISAEMQNLSGQLRNVERNFEQTFNKVQSITKGLNVRQLEDTFKTSFKNISDAGIESFASIQAAGAGFYAAQAALQAKRTIVSSLTAANVAASTGPKAEVAETARFEKIRADALLASRNAFKEFEQTVRSGGKNISGSLAANAASATGLGSALSGVIGIAKSLGLVLGPLAIISFAKGAFTAVGALKDLSDVTGISSDMLLKLKPVLENAGSSAEAFASSINIMQAKIVEGSAETVTTLGKLGISMSEALALADDPEGLLDKFSKGLAGIADQATRVEVARALGGRGGARALQALADPRGLQPIRDQKPIISKEEIDAIDKAGDALNTFKLKLEAIAAVSLLGPIKAFEDFGTAINQVSEGPLGKVIAGLKWIKDNGPYSFFRAPVEFDEKMQEQLRQSLGQPNPVTQAQGAFRNFPAPSPAKVDVSTLTFGGAGGAPGKDASDQQKLFNKSIEETIDGLRAQTRALTESGDAATDHAAKLLEAKAVTLGFAKGSVELTAKLNEFKAATLELKQATFADTLIKQNQAIEVQIVTMTQGAEAGQKLALQHAINNARLSEMGKAARGAADAQAVLNKKLAEAVIPQARKALADDTTEARQQLQVEGPSFNIAAATRDAKQKFIDAMRAVRGSPELKALAFEAILKVTPELDRDKLLAIKVDLGNALGAAEEKGATLNKVFSNTFDIGAAKVDKMREALNALVDESTRLTLKVEQQEIALSKAKGLQPQSQPSTQNLIDASPFGADVKASMAAAFEAISSSSKIAGADIASMTAQLEESRKSLDKVNASAQKLSTATDAATIRDAFKAIDRDIDIAENQAILFGNAFDLAGAKVQAVQSALQGLTVKGIKASNPAAQQIAGDLRAEKISEITGNLEKARIEGEKMGQALGGAFDQVSDNISKTTQAIQDLIRQGVEPADARIQQMQAQLGDLRAIEAFQHGLEGLADVGVDVITGQIKSWKDLGSAVAKVISGIASDWLRAQAKMAINNAVNSSSGSSGGLFNKIPLPQGRGERPPGVEGTSLPTGGVFGTKAGAAGAVGAAGADGSQAAIAAIQAQTATGTTVIQAIQTEATTIIQALSTEATTVIQAGSSEAMASLQAVSGEASASLQAIATESTTAIQAESTTGQSAITTTGSTAQAGIEAVKLAALAAIQAAAAQGGGANVATGGIASLFGGGGSSGPEVGYGGTSLIEDVFAFHTGGIVGAVGFSNRSVDARAFTYAPRYHQGIDYAGGEMPAILKRGEEVGWPDKLAEKYGGRGGGSTIINISNPNFADRRAQSQVMARLAASVKNANRNL